MQTPSGTPGGRPEVYVGVHLKALNIQESDLAHIANPEAKGKGKERRDAILSAIVSEIQSSASHSGQKIPPKYKETLLTVMKETPRTVMEFLRTFLNENEERAAQLVHALHSEAMEKLRTVELPGHLSKGTRNETLRTLAGRGMEAEDVRSRAAKMKGTLHNNGPVPPPPHWGEKAA